MNEINACSLSGGGWAIALSESCTAGMRMWGFLVVADGVSRANANRQ